MLPVNAVAPTNPLSGTVKFYRTKVTVIMLGIIWPSPVVFYIRGFYYWFLLFFIDSFGRV